jgi:hypothetical protein
MIHPVRTHVAGGVNVPEDANVSVTSFADAPDAPVAPVAPAAPSALKRVTFVPSAMSTAPLPAAIVMPVPLAPITRID